MAIGPASAKNAVNLFASPPTPSQGDVLPVYRRADLSRTMPPVAVPSLTAPPTGVWACRVAAADAPLMRDLATDRPAAPSRAATDPYEFAGYDAATGKLE